MSLKLNSTAFGTKVKVTRSGEEGVITAFASYQRTKGAKQFFVEYTDAYGRAAETWFYEDELTVL